MIYAFDEFEVDDDLCELRRGRAVVPLQRRMMGLLLYLLANRHRVVLRSDLVEHVWKGATVTDNAVAQAMIGLRRALDVPGMTPPIATVRGRGYRFVRALEARGECASMRAAS